MSGKRYRMRIPDMRVEDAIGFIVMILKRRERNRFAASPSLALFHASSGAELSRGSMISDFGFADGTELFLA
jgi:hypothetical protein